MKMKERRLLPWETLQNLCIDMGWYTKGNNVEFFDLLSKTTTVNMTTEIIVDIAEDILEHSNDEDLEIPTICYFIAKNCTTIFKYEMEEEQ